MSPLLALTQGDPAGIGPEIALAAWLARENVPAPFFVVGDVTLLRDRAALTGLAVPIEMATPETAAEIFPRAFPVVQVEGTPSGAIVPGRADPAGAPGTIAAIETAVALVRAGRASAVVTNPIAKHVLYEAGFRHPGHTEFLAALAGGDGQAPHPVMMLWCEDLAVVPITTHIALRRVSEVLTADLVRETAGIVDRDLRDRFGLARPRLVLAGLNPHAGEAGTMGTEDRDVLEPAVAALRAEGIDIHGPLPADTLFHARARRGYDAVLAPMHDQALIPIKTIAFDAAVNVTLGLPFVRTSPDHGTAFDIAGRGIARPDSLIAALRLAARLTSARPQT